MRKLFRYWFKKWMWKHMGLCSNKEILDWICNSPLSEIRLRIWCLNHAGTEYKMCYKWIKFSISPREELKLRQDICSDYQKLNVQKK
jgi:hypothetical protein